MAKLTGDLSGIRESVQQELLALYEISAEPTEFLPEALARQLGRLTALTRREIAVYIARNGQILNVSLGQSDRVIMEDYGLRRGEQRLSRVRCIHTHPNGDSRLSEVDIAAMVSFRLDAMCALGVDETGALTGATVSFLAPDESGVLSAAPVSAIPLVHLAHPQLMYTINQNDQLDVAQDTATEDQIERAYLISVDSRESLEELSALADSAGALVVGSALQSKGRPDPATYIGSGKAAEVALDAQAKEASLIIGR